MQNKTNRWTVLALCAIAVTLPGGSQDSSQHCQNLLDTQQYEQALSTCEESFSQHQDAHALLNAASAAGELGQFERALESASKAGGSAQEALPPQHRQERSCGLN